MNQNLTGIDIRQVRKLASELLSVAADIGQLGRQATVNVQRVAWRRFE